MSDVINDAPYNPTGLVEQMIDAYESAPGVMQYAAMTAALLVAIDAAYDAVIAVGMNYENADAHMQLVASARIAADMRDLLRAPLRKEKL